MTAGIPIVDVRGRVLGQISDHHIRTVNGKPDALVLSGYIGGESFTSVIPILHGVPPFTLDTTAGTPDPTPPTQGRDV